MRASFVLLASLGVGLSAIAAPSPGPSRPGQLPGEKLPVVLRDKERNPFARREVKTLAPTPDHASEETRIRALIAAMPVTGVIRGEGAIKVLLGGLILKPGHPIPALIDHQTEHLVVGPITSEKVEIQFVEREERAEPRKIFVTIDLQPHVAVRTNVPVLPATNGTNSIRVPDAPPEGAEP